MHSNIIFIGGIHGVGKSTVCSKICKAFSIEYLSASSVLKWEDLNSDISNKKVKNISFTQDRLVQGLNSLVKAENKYLLDGHFCLFDGEGKATAVPLETFANINPIMLIVIVGEPTEIKDRLNSRDNKSYTTNDLVQMQNIETEHSQFIAGKLGVKCIYCRVDEVDTIIEAIAEVI